MKRIFYFAIFTFALGLFVLHSPKPLVQAAPLYPILELGNCRNQGECYLYCQIPENSPACWSYGKYVLNPPTDILGETTVNITYPIADLGNCLDANACFIYCNQPKNQSSCYSYAKTHGLIQDKEIDDDDLPPEKMQEIITTAQTELGCNSKEQCMSICGQPENYLKCETFARKHNLYRGPPPIDEHGAPPPAEILEMAKTELGCTSESSCKEYCNNPVNAEKCMDFAKNNNLMREDEYEKRKKEFDKYKDQKEKMLAEAKEQLGCNSYESCAKFCANSENVKKCVSLGERHGMGPPPSQNTPPAKPCTTESECRAYCEKNPQECKGFNERESRQETRVDESKKELRNPPVSGSPPPYKQSGQINPGEFLGPGGCKTEGECDSYCEKHPNECPGFPTSSAGGPKDKVTSAPEEFNTQSSSGQKPPANLTFQPSPPQDKNRGSGKTFKPPEYKPPENRPENREEDN